MKYLSALLLSAGLVWGKTVCSPCGQPSCTVNHCHDDGKEPDIPVIYSPPTYFDLDDEIETAPATTRWINMHYNEKCGERPVPEDWPEDRIWDGEIYCDLTQVGLRSDGVVVWRKKQ